MLQGGPDSVNLRDLAGAIKSYRAGLSLLDDSPGSDQDRLALWLDLRLKAGRLLNAHGESAAATDSLRDTLAVTDRMPAAQLANEDIASNRACLFLALSHAEHSNVHQGREYAQAYLNAIAGLVQKDPRNADLQYQLSAAHIELGFLLWSKGLGDPNLALEHYTESLRIREQLVKDYPADEVYRRALMLAYEHYAGLQGSPTLASFGRTEVARRYFKKALAIAEESSADRPNTSAEGEFGSLLIRMAVLDAPAAELAESLATLRRGATLLAKDSSANRELLMTAHQYMGRRLAAMGQYGDAITEYRTALSMAGRLLANQPADEGARQHVAQTEALLTECQLKADSGKPLGQVSR